VTELAEDANAMETAGRLPRAGRIEVWVADITRLPEDSLAGLLTGEERERAARFRSEPARDLFVASRALQRVLAGRYLGVAPDRVRIARHCQLCGDPGHGRPRLADARGLDFSVSHSGVLVALGYAASGRLGIDVEAADRRLDVASLSDTVLSADEAALLASTPQTERQSAFHRLWTRKEAALKLTGHGLAVPLASLSVAADRGRVSPVPVGWPREPIRLLDLRLPDGYLGALATTLPDAELAVRAADHLL
jgi:4'-phosphopantetheinyl transferase